MPEKTLRDELLESFFLSITARGERSNVLKNTISVSRLVSDCYRQMYYSVLFPIEIFDPRSAIRMWVGRKLHETRFIPDSIMEFEVEWNGVYHLKRDNEVIAELKSHDKVEVKTGSDFQSWHVYQLYFLAGGFHHTVKLNGEVLDDVHLVHIEPGLFGHVDEYSPSKKLILEKKTVRKIPRDAYEHHKKQVYYYAAIMADLGFEVEKGAVFYVDVNDARPNVFDFDIPDLWEIGQELTVKFETLKKAINEKILPPRYLTTWEDTSPRLKCEYCSYFAICIRENVVSNAIEEVAGFDDYSKGEFD